MDYLRFFLSNKKLISFGFFLTFFSSFGQTFLVSLYVPSIMSEFGLTNGEFGILYGAATVFSGFCLVYGGRFIDSCNLRTYTLSAVILLMASCFVVSASSHLVWVFLGFWGLRFGGQGLLSHISNTSISKFFSKRRGTALSLSVMGYSVGEACLPFVIGCTIALIGWRYSMFLNGILMGLTLVPFVFVALSDKRHRIPDQQQSRPGSKVDSVISLWKDKRFIIIVASMFILPFMTTGFLFHQLRLADEKGWAVELLTASFLGFALGRSLFSLVSGKLIDKYSALRVFPYYLSPFLAGLLILALFDSPLAAPVYLALTGITMGMSSTTTTALLAEVYGTQSLGRIRAMSVTVIVFGTALSPAIFGVLLDAGISFRLITAGSACLIACSMLANSRLKYYFESAAHKSSAKKICCEV
ncbi:putative 3-hydroxyphenylpropionic transporter MhpT [Limihaloglobus sulfuriphilus]|uniref:Putative 3-hydroxyphenylpropionic transporter MhpT n=1 Tax=Limihaloglobus sulfuriphilus TaxID=1851148 RepID=A0A1Q2MHY4_9BACT|nr:MFS transporter [Limihaloglobus sulfuriphilus]AQQ71907.1 putative 3-hydroxyphenylpropionic transporter MhpT [Limihaloglobus sulfuriphilus]